MNATIKSEKKHFPVLLNELINIISPLYGGTFVDCTFGNGGYSKEILKHPKNKILAIDRDTDVFKISNMLKSKYKNRFNFQNLKFSQIDEISKKFNNLKGIIFDLGYSLNQIENYSRGFSFKSNSKLNMTMGLNTFTAYDVINKLKFEELSKIIKYFGDENKAKLISKRIVQIRNIREIDTPELVSIINKTKKIRKNKIHNATKTFQAIRIFVNNEISELIYGLINSFKILPVGGVIVVVTFHSLEDKIVKFFFKNYSESRAQSRYLPKMVEKKNVIRLNDKKPILPSFNEIKINPPSRSAKLRYGFKLRENDDFDDFIKKFQFYLDIEKIGNKL